MIVRTRTGLGYHLGSIGWIFFFLLLIYHLFPATSCKSDLSHQKDITKRNSQQLATSQYFLKNKGKFHQKADHEFLRSLGTSLKAEGYCKVTESVVIGGLNQGQAASFFLSACPDIKLHGFEINVDELTVARKTLSLYPNVIYRNFGMGDMEFRMKFRVAGSKSGYFDASKKGVVFQETSIVQLATYFSREENYEEKILYSLIDVEGFESCVIMGLSLQHENNRKRFSAFQYELGGTWAAKDPRHPPGSMTQTEIADFLEKRGYNLYIIGEDVLLKVNSNFFSDTAPENEGAGPFIQGNALAVHPQFANTALLKFISEKTLKVMS